MLSEAHRPPADPSAAAAAAATENLLMLAIQERLQHQFRPPVTANNSAAATATNLFNHQLNLNQSLANQDVNRLFQQMLPLLGLPPLLPGLPNPLDLGCLPGTSMTHPLWQHNLCAWPECNQPCENLAVFLNHLSQAHTFNERWVRTLCLLFSVRLDLCFSHRAAQRPYEAFQYRLDSADDQYWYVSSRRASRRLKRLRGCS